MGIYTKIICKIIERMQETTNYDRIYAYMDVAQMIRDELSQEYQRNAEHNSGNAGDGKSAAETQ